MKIKKISIHNIKAIGDKELDLNGSSIIVMGGNDRGKSTLLTFLQDRIVNEKPELILKRGEIEGEATMELTTGEKFVYTNKSGKEKLRFTSRDEITTDVTRQISEKYFKKAFSIDKFLMSGPADRVKMLKEHIGVDTTEIDNEYSDAYSSRTLANKAFDQVRDLKIDYDETQIVDVSELRTELAIARESNDKRSKSISAIENFKQQLEQAKKSYDERTVMIEGLILDYQKQIDELTKKMQGCQDDLVNSKTAYETDVETKEKRIAEGEKWIEGNPQIDVIEIEAKISAQDGLMKIKENKEIFEKRLKEADDLDAKVKEIDARRKKMLSESNLPEGIVIDGTDISVDGLPLDEKQLSTSQIYIAGIKIAAMNLAKVKAIHFDAAPLDNVSLKKVIEWADSQDLQLLIETPDKDGGEITYEIIGPSDDKQ